MAWSREYRLRELKRVLQKMRDEGMDPEGDPPSKAAEQNDTRHKAGWVICTARAKVFLKTTRSTQVVWKGCRS
jgi:hypothetical protein